jgi:lipoprotein-anchoring transpeptidase ErfK/SrfK
MIDYYAVLSRAVRVPGSGDEAWRRDIYDRARQMLASQLRTRHPPLPSAEAGAEQAALEAAIERIESELALAPGRAAAQHADARAPRSDIAREAWIAPEARPMAQPLRRSRAIWVILAVVVAAVGAGGYAFWTKAPKPAVPAIKREAPGASPAPRAARATRTAIGNDGDLPPGVDGGSSDADLSYVYRRQPVYYRTTHPVGTIVVDKLQHFAYLIQPNSVALRYGIGLGAQCADLAGLRRIASKSEWPQWQPPPEMIERKLARPGVVPGGPGNPLGARVLELDDGSSRIHGTNAPKTIGRSVAFGCVRLVNDDIVDLYNRVPSGTRVVIGN